MLQRGYLGTKPKRECREREGEHWLVLDVFVLDIGTVDCTGCTRLCGAVFSTWTVTRCCCLGGKKGDLAMAGKRTSVSVLCDVLEDGGLQGGLC